MLTSSREERLPGSRTPQEIDFRKILAVTAIVRDKFKTDPEDSPFMFRMLSAPDLGENVIRALTFNGFEKQPFAPQAA